MYCEIGNKIKDARKRKNISKQEIADNLGVSFEEYIDIEEGNIILSYLKVKKIANILGIKEHELIDIKEKGDFTENFTDNEVLLKQIENVKNILEVFMSHERLYIEMKHKRNRINIDN